MLVIRKERETFDKVVEAIILTTVNLILFSVLQHALEWIPRVRFDHQDFFTAGNLLLMTFCALSIGLGWSAEANNDWIYKRLRKFGITKKTTHVSTWNETFHGNAKYIVVHLKDGRRAYGYPAFYSDDPTERAIFLQDASWLSAENALLNSKPISMLLDKESGIELIEFVDFDQKQDNSGERKEQEALPENGKPMALAAVTEDTAISAPTASEIPVAASLPQSDHEQTGAETRPQ